MDSRYPRHANAIAVASAGMGKSALLEHFANQKCVVDSLQRLVVASLKRFDKPPLEVLASYQRPECICLAVTFNGQSNIRDIPSDSSQLGSYQEELVMRLLFE